uniref:Uncharacterized protein n=1 Tax=Anguilla anguilla TaxID=7936 RepID=A0A0E9UML3_ANGAN
MCLLYLFFLHKGYVCRCRNLAPFINSSHSITRLPTLYSHLWTLS